MAVFTGNGSVGSPSFTFSSDIDTGIYRPGENQLSLVTGANTRIFMDSDGKVAVGTSTPSSRTFTVAGSIGLLSATTERFSISSSTSPSPTYTVRAGNFFLNLESEGTSQSGVIFSTGTTSVAERARVTSDGYLRMASGTGGIQFNGDTAAANALDDYEEGTIPGANLISTNITASSGINTFGFYTKIGQFVRVTWTIRPINFGEFLIGNTISFTVPFTPGHGGTTIASGYVGAATQSTPGPIESNANIVGTTATAYMNDVGSANLTAKNIWINYVYSV